MYQGTILEHLLIQHLTAFYEVGEHNIFRLRGADPQVPPAPASPAIVVVGEEGTAVNPAQEGLKAAIIGAGDGNFIADRNGIARVWMDHALWPLMTTKLYIDQTGDLNILNSPAPYLGRNSRKSGAGRAES